VITRTESKLSLPRARPLSSGDARHFQWQATFQKLAEAEPRSELQRTAVRELAAIRTKWMVEPDLLVRAARHYVRRCPPVSAMAAHVSRFVRAQDGASQILVSRCVKTVSVDFQEGTAAPLNKWVHVRAPVRLDLAGGWSGACCDGPRARAHRHHPTGLDCRYATHHVRERRLRCQRGGEH
jgi:hypothetical protein